jgi:hypothetical protein
MKPFRQITNIRRLIRVALLAFTVIWILPNANADFTFLPGHIYSTFREIGNTQDIIEYSETGTVLGSLTPPSLIEGDELHGIAFGADGFLYAVKVHFAESGFSVLVLDSSGTVYAAYTMDGIYYGNLSYGKVALDQQYIYVAGGGDLVRFTVGNPNSGVSIYTNNQVFDVKILPNGHLFVAHAYGIDEITNAGTIVRSISLIGADFVDVRGIEYDPAIDKLFVTELGYTNFEFRLMRINASTGVLENSVYFVYGDDLFLTQSNTLLVGSRTETPRIYNENCAFLRTLGTAERMFVTQYISIVIPLRLVTSTVTANRIMCSTTRVRDARQYGTWTTLSFSAALMVRLFQLAGDWWMWRTSMVMATPIMRCSTPARARRRSGICPRSPL